MKSSLRILCGFLLLWSGPSSAADQPEKARAWEGSLSIPTYLWGPNDPNPRFEELEDSIIYPYAMQDNLTQKREDHTWKALFLENEYLKVTCLPDLGGRIHSVLDKTTGQEMFLKNNVIKPSLIAMRGAWISGGIEWNTGPHGHTVTAVSPVDAMVREDPDGSASLFISNTEKIFRTRWTVRVTLYPGKSYLHERIRIYNPTDGVHPYYFWNCTAFPCLPGTRFMFPMTLGTDHGGKNFFHWPVDEGKDLTWLKNYDKPTSIFAYHCEYDFFGAYDTDLDRGIVQYADHQVLPGKKAWTWGQSEDGLMSERALSDDGSQYIEVQSGPLLTQSDYGLLEPHKGVAWEEWWYPVHGLGKGFEYATPDVVVQTDLEEAGDNIKLSLLSTSVIPSAQIRVSSKVGDTGKTSSPAKEVDLSPNKATQVEFSVSPGSVHTTEICSKDGTPLANFETPLPIPHLDPPAEPEEPKSESDLSADKEYQKARLADQATNRVGARAGYEKALSKNPQHAPSLKGLAILDLESGLYEASEKRLRHLLDIEPADGMAWYYLGAGLLKQGKDIEAQVCAARAVEFLPQSSQGFDLLGRVQMRKKQLMLAVASFKLAVGKDPLDDRAADHLLLALWSAGYTKEAEPLAHNRIEKDPTALLPRLVLANLEKKSDFDLIHQAASWLGDDGFEVEETALVMEEVGLVQGAVDTIGACLESSSQFTGSSLGQLRSLLDYYHQFPGIRTPIVGPWDPHKHPVFASRPEEIPLYQSILKGRAGSPIPGLETPKEFPVDPSALKESPGMVSPQAFTASTHLALGNLLAGLLRLEEAVPHWEEAVKLDPCRNVAYRNLGLYQWKKKANLEQAESFYRKAIYHSPPDEILYRDLGKILMEAKKVPEAIALIEAFPTEKITRNDLLETLARAYNSEHRFDDTISLFDESTFSNWEGQRANREVWATALIDRGKTLFDAKNFDGALADFERSLTYPENLGVGRPTEPDEAEVLYWKGKALSELGRTEEARAAWKQGAAGPSKAGKQDEYREECKQALGP
jgi:tetratricopeptide (TPR) repeat protein